MTCTQTVTQIAFEILQAAKAYGLPASRWTDFDARIRAAQAPADYADARLAAQNNRVILDLLKEINALKAQLSETTRPDRNKDG